MDSDERDVHFIAADTTKYFADSIEWCPFEHLSNYFVCGSYQLDEESSTTEHQIRQGSLTLYKLDSNHDTYTTKFNLSIVDIIPTHGILDMKWCPNLLNNKSIIAVVSSNGEILLKFLKADEMNVSLCSLTQHDLAKEEDKMVLSVDWSWQNENSASLIVSDTKGTLGHFQIRETDIYLLNSWKAHNFESWTSSFNYFDSNIIYSGGDDCCFKGWDVRSLSSPTFINKCHSMGVTAISKNKLNENLLVSGSYDENIFLWDIRNMNSTLSEISVHGGVWRLKWHPTDSKYLLAAAMHNGFHVLSITCNELQLDLSYDKHESLAYGVDWSHITTNTLNFHKSNNVLHNNDMFNIKNIIASCSFYDNLVHIWGINF